MRDLGLESRPVLVLFVAFPRISRGGETEVAELPVGSFWGGEYGLNSCVT